MVQNYEDLGIDKMVAGFFRNNDKLGYILLPFAAIFVWSFSLMFPLFHQYPSLETSFLLKFCLPKPSINLLLGFNLVFAIINGYLITFLCAKHEITDKQNLLPGFFLILFSGLLNFSGALNPIIPAVTFLIFSLFRIFSVYRVETSYADVFDAGFLLAIAILIYSPFVVFIPLPFISLLILKPFKLREWIIGVLGIITPILIFGALLFIGNSNPIGFIKLIIDTPNKFHGFDFGKGSFLIHSAIILCLFLGFIYMMGKSNMQKIKSQKIKYVLLWLMLLGVLGVLSTNNNQFFLGSFVIVSLSIVIGDLIGTTKKKGLSEFLTLLILVAYVCSNLQVLGYL